MAEFRAHNLKVLVSISIGGLSAFCSLVNLSIYHFPAHAYSLHVTKRNIQGEFSKDILSHLRKKDRCRRSLRRPTSLPGGTSAPVSASRFSILKALGLYEPENNSDRDLVLYIGTAAMTYFDEGKNLT